MKALIIKFLSIMLSLNYLNVDVLNVLNDNWTVASSTPIKTGDYINVEAHNPTENSKLKKVLSVFEQRPHKTDTSKTVFVVHLEPYKEPKKENPHERAFGFL